MTKPVLHPSMRAHFAHAIYKKMKRNKKIWLIVGDLGYKMWDKVKQDFPDRFINVGAAEQAMLGIAIGLSHSGKIPVVYSITTFLLYRPFETLRTYINYEKIPVKLIGGGRGKDYIHDGISHWSEDDKIFISNFKNIHSIWPEKNEEIEELVDNMLKSKSPWYINLKR